MLFEDWWGEYTMKIGVDAYYLYAPRNDGIGNYVLRMLAELSLKDRSNHYILYTPGITHREYAELYLKNKNFTIKIVPGIMNSRRRLWLQSPSMLKEIKNDSIDLFFGGGEYFPLLIDRRVIVISAIHDVAFRMVPEAISWTNKIFYHFLFPFFIRRADAFFTVSNNSRDEMVKFLKIKRDDIYVIYNGIKIADYLPNVKVKKKRYILFVGTLQPRKNLVNLINAYALIANTIPDDLVIVGARSWKNSHLSDVIDRLPEEISRRITFLGYLSSADLVTLYQEARVFALLSMHEGFCLPILESMASGTAVLTSPMGAIPEVFQDAVHYADPQSPSDIARALEDLLNHDSLRKKFEQKGLKHAKRYDISIQAENVMKAFKAVFVSKRPKK